jgi:hypothetical protein
MSSSPAHRVRLGRDPGDLLAALPHVLGFHPTGSLVVLALTGDPPRATVDSALRTDLVAPGQHPDLAEHLADVLTRQRIDRVIVAVIGNTADASGEPPHRELITAVGQAFARENITVVHALWTAATRRGQPWRCYQHPDCRGTLADPDTSPVAAAAVVAGHRTYASRAALADQLTPDDGHALARRARLLAGRTPRLDADGVGVGRALTIVTGAIEATTEGRPPATDIEIALLAACLSDPRVTEQCLAISGGRHAEAAEQLWRVLTRTTPAPYRAEPAILLAVTAYLRGDGALAHLALDAARTAAPDHVMVSLLRRVFQTGITPPRLRALTVQAASGSDPAPSGIEPSSADGS